MTRFASRLLTMLQTRVLVAIPALRSSTPSFASVGPIVWFDIPVRDLESTSVFYARVFEWSIGKPEKDIHGVHRVVFKDGQPIGSLAKLTSSVQQDGGGRVMGSASQDLPTRPRGVGVTFATTNLRTVLARVAKSGGRVVLAPAPTPDNRGLIACFHDPNANELCLFEAYVPSPG